MYRLTSHNAYELYVELEDWGGVVKYARYSSFSVGAASNYYPLNAGGYSGTAGDGFVLSYPSSGAHLNGMGFSTRDQDHDRSSGSCSSYSAFSGGWWFNWCGNSALNGPYLRPSDRTEYSGYGIDCVVGGASESPDSSDVRRASRNGIDGGLSVSNDASQLVQSGNNNVAGPIMAGESGDLGTPSHAFTSGDGDRHLDLTATFSRAFRTIPVVTVGLRHVDHFATEIRVSATVQSVSNTSLTVRIGTWVDSRLYAAHVYWMACA
uniref:Fibrinogen C-terminal domain-containing protein n=1 Tax=Branchiostoma floridae TaxID=7739 RepID=C3XSX3_BRAFL|eukprot:XP_002612832.1 hypothetical protein BRAFLDRAFT_67220 [Branchiostoma floridae]